MRNRGRGCNPGQAWSPARPLGLPVSCRPGPPAPIRRRPSRLPSGHDFLPAGHDPWPLPLCLDTRAAANGRPAADLHASGTVPGTRRVARSFTSLGAPPEARLAAQRASGSLPRCHFRSGAIFVEGTGYVVVSGESDGGWAV